MKSFKFKFNQSRRHIIACKVELAKLQRFHGIISLALEKIRSEAAEVAGIAIYLPLVNQVPSLLLLLITEMLWLRFQIEENVLILLPQVWISTWNDGKTSGTSMASPHVAGVVALAMAERSFPTVAQVHDYIKSIGTRNKITGQLNNAPNSLLYNGFN